VGRNESVSFPPEIFSNLIAVIRVSSASGLRRFPVIVFGSHDSRMKKLSHIDDAGHAAMVDISAKPVVLREAVARGEIHLERETLALIESNQIAKGNVFATARLAGIMAAKKTGELIPLCHPLPITHCEVNFEILSERDRIVITASAKIASQTGVEMEALTAVSVAALTIYDMCKAVDKQMRITDVVLVSKIKRPSSN
jgi:cyclic pyranopterin phosphate synthase